MTENTAFHNRGVRDTDLDNDDQRKAIVTAQRRDDMDQFRIPQGSWFMELYCARNSVSNNASLPLELYDSNTGSLDLGRWSPARTFGMNGRAFAASGVAHGRHGVARTRWSWWTSGGRASARHHDL